MTKEEIRFEKEMLQKIDDAVKANDWDKVDKLRAELAVHRMEHPLPVDDDEDIEEEELEDEEVDEDYFDEDKPYKSWEQRAWEDSGMTWKDFA